MKHNTDDILKAVATRHGISENEVVQSIREALNLSQDDSEASEHPADLEAFLQKVKDGALDNQTKLLMARDVILAYLMELDLWKDEAVIVLQMCQSEINAWEKRSEFDVM